uniref:mitogen-activated protein kinase kinase n=1 Tax=Acrobeloides nanus TaxID=290746 RepID=A0A914CTN9_9BILA
MAKFSYIVEFFDMMTNQENDEFHPNELRFSKDSPVIRCSSDDFEVFSQHLGSGGFGTVMKAKHIPTGALLAAKFQPIVFDPKSDEAKDPLTRARTYKLLKREINGLRKAESPYVTAYYGIMMVEKFVVICMEIMDYTASNLYKRMKLENDKTARFDEKALSIIATNILKALLYLKQEIHLLHRDVKPSNILLNYQGDVKLSDLGLAVYLDTTTPMNVAAGTTIYMAPEILDQPFGKNVKMEFNSQADLWSLGITLVEIARFQHPYYNCISMVEAIFSTLLGDPPILREDEGYTEDLLYLVNNCLIKDPTMRPRVERIVEMKLVKKFDDLDRNKEYMKKIGNPVYFNSITAKFTTI